MSVVSRDNQMLNEELVCNFITAVKSGTYDMTGEIVVTGGRATVGGGTTTTGMQKFSLTFFILGSVGLAGYAAAGAGDSLRRGLVVIAWLMIALVAVILTGGGALLDGLDQYLRSYINLAVSVADEPRYATVNGLVKLFDDPKLLERVSRNDLGILQNAEIPFEA